MAVLGIVIIYKAAMIQVKDKEYLMSLVEKKHISQEEMPAERGKIYSEDGRLLSSTIPLFDVFIDYQSINVDTFNTYIDELTKGIAVILGGSAQEYKRKMTAAFHQKEGNRYWLLQKKVSYSEYQQLRELPIFKKGAYGGGFIAESKPTRIKPYGMLASRTIGIHRVNASNVGLEQKYDEFLAGEDGMRIMRRVAGNVWEPVKGSEIDPKNGLDIVTTIDVDIQDITEHALLDIMTEYKSQHGTAIVMEVQTGKIKAIANLGLQENGTYAEDLNYALMPSEPGSTFKLMSLLALIDDGYVTIEDKVDVEGGMKRFGKQRIVDDSRGMGVITVKQAFEKSSNVAFAKLVDQHYKSNPMKFIKRLQKMRLHERTGIDLLGEYAPLIKTTSSSSWNKVTSLPWIAYGYESLITPIHTLMVYNAVANDGKLMRPYLVSEIKEFGRTVEKIEPVVLESKIAKPATIKQLQEVMHGVVENGTGRSLKSPYYHSGGKTGTAQVADKGITYRDGVRQGSFVGYFPVENPKYTIAVLIRSQPHGVYYGAILGGGVFKKIADKLYASKVGGWDLPIDSTDHFSMPPAKVYSEEMKLIASNLGWTLPNVQQSQLMNYYFEEKRIKNTAIASEEHNQKIPDFTGMALKDALYLAETKGLKVRIFGKGKIASQSIEPGSIINKNTVITFNLN